MRRCFQFRFKGRKTIRKHSAIGIDEDEDSSLRRLNAFISREGNASMILPQRGDRERFAPMKDRFGRNLIAAIVHKNNFELRIPLLETQRLQASFKNSPIVVDGYNDAEQRGGFDCILVFHLGVSWELSTTTGDCTGLESKRGKPQQHPSMTQTKDWFRPDAFLVLPQNVVHVWGAALDVDRETQEKCVGVLSENERSRAERFVLERDRTSFIAAHGILRALLARYLGCTAEGIQFTYGPYGKPAISHPQAPYPLSFNLSHSHGLAAVAVVRNREIGVDVEKIRPEFAGEDIAKRYFSPTEVAELRRLPEERRAEGFFLCWTRKEAYVKALGEGLHFPLDGFSVSLTPGEPVRLRAEDSIRWSIQSFAPSRPSGVTHVGAVVCEGNDWTVQQLDWAGFGEARGERP